MCQYDSYPTTVLFLHLHEELVLSQYPCGFWSLVPTELSPRAEVADAGVRDRQVVVVDVHHWRAPRPEIAVVSHTVNGAVDCMKSNK